VELTGTLSLDRPAKEVLLYVQSAPAGVDILLARLSVVEVNLEQHRQQLAEQTDKVRTAGHIRWPSLRDLWGVAETGITLKLVSKSCTLPEWTIHWPVESGKDVSSSE
jgi:hypothetical protein